MRRGEQKHNNQNKNVKGNTSELSNTNTRLHFDVYRLSNIEAAAVAVDCKRVCVRAWGWAVGVLLLPFIDKYR